MLSMLAGLGMLISYLVVLVLYLVAAIGDGVARRPRHWLHWTGVWLQVARVVVPVIWGAVMTAIAFSRFL